MSAFKVLECLSLLTVFIIRHVVSDIPASSIGYCEGMMNYYMAEQKKCPFSIYFEQALPECICINGIYKIDWNDCSRKYGRGEGFCFKSAKATGQRIKAIQLVGPNDFINPQVLITTNKSGEHFRLELIAGKTANNTFGLTKNNTDTRKFSFTELYATSAKIFTGIPTNGEDTKAALCIEAYSIPGDYKCTHIGSMEDVEIIITKTLCTDELKEPAEIGSTGCLTLKSDLESECKLECDPLLENNFYDPNCTVWNDKLLFENSYYDRKMKEHGLMTQLNENPSVLQDMKPQRTFDLFKQMKDITKQFCDAKYVEPSWIEHVMELFYVLYKGTEYQSQETISEDDYMWITDILSQCMSAGHTVNLTNKDPNKPDTNTDCNVDGGRAWGYCSPNNTEKCVDAEQVLPHYEKFGNILKTKHYTPEVAWNVLDAVQAICFREFNSSYRMFHLLEQSVEKLFTPRIKDLWYNPAYLKNPLVKSRLFGAGSDETMSNIEICIGSAYAIINKENYNKTIIPRLIRPKHEKYLTRKKRDAALPGRISLRADAFCVTSKAQAPQFYSQPCSKKPSDTDDSNDIVTTLSPALSKLGPPADYELQDPNSDS